MRGNLIVQTKVTPEGWMVIEGDLISGWVEESKELAHDKFLIPLACTNIPELDSGVVIDVGANIGTHSVSYAKKIAPLTGTLICIEAGMTAFECLKHNAEKFESKVLLLNCAASDVHGETVEHTVNVTNVGGSTVGDQTNEEVCSNRVRTITIDGLLEDGKITHPVSFIKIDVEGYEMKVLKGAVNTLRQHKPILLMEMNSFRLQENGTTYVQIYDWLLAEGYSWRICEPESKGGDLCYNIMCWPNAVVAARKLPGDLIAR